MPAAKQIEFGGHALVWVGDWSPASARAAISSAARNGYDYIELAIFDPWNFDTKLTKDLLQEFGLRDMHTCRRVGILQVVNELLQVFNGVDVVVRRWAD